MQSGLTPILPGSVLFSSIDIGNAGLALYDVPHYPSDGQGTLFDANTQVPCGVINYLTGVYSITFPVAPKAGANINSQVVYYQPSLPQAMLYYANTITLRPVPDQPYKISFEVYKAPVDLDANNLNPELDEYWQLIAIAVARKILQDSMDMDTVALLEPEYRVQMNLCNRRSLVQYTNERPATIYTQQTDGTNGYNGWGGGMGSF